MKCVLASYKMPFLLVWL